MGVVGVVVVVVVEAMQGEVVLGCSFCVVMGATRKSFYDQKRFHGSIFLDPLPPNIFHGTSFFTHRNERRPRLKSLSALPPPDCPPKWKRGTFLKIHGGSNLIVFIF